MTSAIVGSHFTRSAAKKRQLDVGHSFFSVEEQPAAQKQKCCSASVRNNRTRSYARNLGVCESLASSPRHRCTATIPLRTHANDDAQNSEEMKIEAVTIRFIDADLQLDKSISIMASSTGKMLLRQIINTHCYSSLWQLPPEHDIRLRVTCALHPECTIMIHAGEDVCFTQNMFHTHASCSNLAIFILVPWKADANTLIKSTAQYMNKIPIPAASEMDLTEPSIVFMLLHRLEYLDSVMFSTVLLELVAEPCCLDLIRKVHLYSRLFTAGANEIGDRPECLSDTLQKRHALQIWKILVKDASLDAYDRCDMIYFLLLIVSGKIGTEQRNCFAIMEPYLDAAGFKNGAFIPNNLDNATRHVCDSLLCSIYGLLLSILSSASFWNTIRCSDMSILQNTTAVLQLLSCYLHNEHFLSSAHINHCQRPHNESSNILSPVWIFWMYATLSMPMRQNASAALPPSAALHRHWAYYMKQNPETPQDNPDESTIARSFTVLGTSYFQVCDVFGNMFPKLIRELQSSMHSDNSLRWEWNEYTSDSWCTQIARIDNADDRRNIQEQVSMATHIPLIKLQCSPPRERTLNHYSHNILATLDPPTNSPHGGQSVYTSMVTSVAALQDAQQCAHHGKNGSFMQGDNQLRAVVYAARSIVVAHGDILRSINYKQLVTMCTERGTPQVNPRSAATPAAASSSSSSSSSKTRLSQKKIADVAEEEPCTNRQSSYIWLRNCENTLLDCLEACMHACTQAFQHYLMNAAAYSTSFMQAPVYLAYIMFDMYTTLNTPNIFQLHSHRAAMLVSLMKTHILSDPNLVALWNRFTYMNERTCIIGMHIDAAILMKRMNFQMHFLTKHKLFRLERGMHRRLQCRDANGSRTFTIRRDHIVTDSCDMFSSLCQEAKTRDCVPFYF